jgi:hypothetical protein
VAVKKILKDAQWIQGGKPHQRIMREAEERWCVSVDLGQASDYTAISVIHHELVPLDEFTVSPPEKENIIIKQKAEQRFTVRALERLQLGMPYTDQVAYVGELLRRPPLPEVGADLVIDGSGVGRPVADMFEAANLQPHQIYITAGFEVERKAQRVFTVPKVTLISNLDAQMHSGSLQIHNSLTEAGALKEELRDIRRSITAAGRVTYQARGSQNDDLVLSIACGLWWCTRPRMRATTGFVRGLY